MNAGPLLLPLLYQFNTSDVGALILILSVMLSLYYNGSHRIHCLSMDCLENQSCARISLLSKSCFLICTSLLPMRNPSDSYLGYPRSCGLFFLSPHLRVSAPRIFIRVMKVDKWFFWCILPRFFMGLYASPWLFPDFSLSTEDPWETYAQDSCRTATKLPPLEMFIYIWEKTPSKQPSVDIRNWVLVLTHQLTIATLPLFLF